MSNDSLSSDSSCSSKTFFLLDQADNAPYMDLDHSVLRCYIVYSPSISRFNLGLYVIYNDSV